ncbi:hypothetical protein ACFLVY_01765 [Chloroflexota bacterium]
MKVARETLGLAAEFATASELCRRDVYAQLTLGLRKRTDLLIETETRMLRVQVKGKQSRVWPACRGVCGEDIVLVFVDFEKKEDCERPDFYILTPKDWQELLDRELMLPGKVDRGEVSIDKQNVPIWKDGYRGMSIKPTMIQEQKERWDKIEIIIKNTE